MKRKPRFRRSNAIGTMYLTERDIAIITHVARHRLLDSRQIIALLGCSSSQQILRRLQLLYHHRYLDRPRAQMVQQVAFKGSRPIIYALGNRGADVLAERYGIARGNINWHGKNTALQARFLKHTTMVASVMVSVEVACGGSSTIEMIRNREKAERRVPHRWYVETPEGTIGIVPDAFFGLYIDANGAAPRTAYFFLELDRGTMPIKRRRDEASSDVFDL